MYRSQGPAPRVGVAGNTTSRRSTRSPRRRRRFRRPATAALFASSADSPVKAGKCERGSVPVALRGRRVRIGRKTEGPCEDVKIGGERSGIAPDEAAVLTRRARRIERDALAPVEYDERRLEQEHDRARKAASGRRVVGRGEQRLGAGACRKRFAEVRFLASPPLRKTACEPIADECEQRDRCADKRHREYGAEGRRALHRPGELGEERIEAFV